MAHYAKVEDGIVTQVIVADSKEWCQANLGGEWVQTSYNGTICKNYAGIGFTYDQGRDAFISPKPFASSVLNEETCQWEYPIPRPTDGKFYKWDEESTSWTEIAL